MRFDIAKCNADRIIRLPDSEIADRYRAGETVSELAIAYCVSPPTITKSLDRSGIERRAAKQRPSRLSGEKNPSWRGGRRQRADGYWLVWTKDGERLEHRVVMEVHVGRRLTEKEIVHHRDGDKSNNDPSNLEILSQSAHAATHAPELIAARGGHRGACNPRAKLTSAQVSEVRTSNDASRTLASRFGVHASTIQRIKNGKAWGHE